MILKDIKLPMTHKIFLISDTHEGTILKHKKGIKDMCEAVMAEPNNYVCHLGDVIEGIMIDDKRYCPDTIDPQSPRPLIQYQEAIKEFWDIQDRLLVVLDGNHDYKISGKHGNMLESVFCKELEGERSIYGTYSAKLSMRDTKGRLMYKMFLTHGNGSINSSADDPVRRLSNWHLSLKRKLYELAGDCLIMGMGHTHKLLVKPPITQLYLTDDGRELKHKHTSTAQTADYIPPDLRWYVNTGCFYKLYELGVSGYAERAMYRPNELGYAIIHVKDGVVRDIERVVI